MANNPNHVIMVAGIVSAGMENYTKRFLNKLMAHSRQHDGCLIYNIHQSDKNPREFMMYSVWKTRDAFEKHNQTVEMQEFKQHLAKAMFDIQSPRTTWHLLEEKEED
ncbi:MAG: antibiotic biosynthesis monooxygenase family protein [Pseudomonadota bacterium]